MAILGHINPGVGQRMVEDMRLPVSLAVLVLTALTAGCGQGGKDATRLRDETGAFRPEPIAAAETTTTTIAETTTTTIAPTTTTTAAPTTTTSTRPAITPTSAPPATVPVTAPAAPPSCSLRALASPVFSGMQQTLYLTSNLPNNVVRIEGYRLSTDASGNARADFPVVGRSRINNVDATFYTEPWTLDDFVDFTMPPELVSCSTSYQVVGR